MEIKTRKTADSEYFAMRILNAVHDVAAFAILTHAAIGLAALPNAVPPMFIPFGPPVIAFLFLICNTGKFNATVLAGCRLFLGTIAASVLLSHLPFVLPNLKPQFPGLPPQQDRVLCFFFAVHGIFMWILCPGYVLGISLYYEYKGLPRLMSRPILYAGLACWLLSMGFLIFASVMMFHKLF